MGVQSRTNKLVQISSYLRVQLSKACLIDVSDKLKLKLIQDGGQLQRLEVLKVHIMEVDRDNVHADALDVLPARGQQTNHRQSVQIEQLSLRTFRHVKCRRRLT